MRVEAHESFGVFGGLPAGGLFECLGEGVCESGGVADGSVPAESEVGDHGAEPAEVGGDDGSSGCDGAEGDVAEADMGGVGDCDDIAGGECRVELLVCEVAIEVDEAPVLEQVCGLGLDDRADRFGGPPGEEEAVGGLDDGVVLGVSECADEPIHSFLGVLCPTCGNQASVAGHAEDVAGKEFVKWFDAIDGVGEGGAASGEGVAPFSEPLLGEDIDEEEALCRCASEGDEGEFAGDSRPEGVGGVGEAAAVHDELGVDGFGEFCGAWSEGDALGHAVGGGDEDVVGSCLTYGLEEESRLEAGAVELGACFLVGTEFEYRCGVDVGCDLVCVGVKRGRSGSECDDGPDAGDGLEGEEDLSDIGEAVAG